MSMASTETTGREVATYGGFADAFGGCATVVLAIVALSGTRPDILIGIATIIFAAALLIQSGTLLSEMSAGAAVPAEGGSGGLSYVLLGGLAGVVLGILALIGVHAVLLASIAVIVFGTCMAFGSSAVYQAFQVRRSFAAGGRAPTEVLINEIAAGSSGLQAMAGLAAIVLGILAVTGINPAILSLVALLEMGGALVLTGGTIGTVAQGFMRRQETRGRFSPAE